MAKSSFVTHTPALNIPLLSRLYKTLYVTNLILHSHLFTFTFSVPLTPSDTENYFSPDDPNITNLMVSHFDCAKQHKLRQYNLLNVKQCAVLEQKRNALTLLNVLLMPKRKGRFASKVQSNIVVSIKPYGTTKHYHFLLLPIL